MVTGEKKEKGEEIGPKWWLSSLAKMQRYVAVLVGPVFLFGALGWWIDDKFDKGPIFLTIFSLFGFISSIIFLFKIIKKDSDGGII